MSNDEDEEMETGHRWAQVGTASLSQGTRGHSKPEPGHRWAQVSTEGTGGHRGQR